MSVRLPIYHRATRARTFTACPGQRTVTLYPRTSVRPVPVIISLPSSRLVMYSFLPSILLH